MPYMRLQISLLILLIPWVGSPAQSDTTSAVPKTEKQALYAGAGYGSNMIYLGSTFSQNQPYLYGALSWALSGKIYLSGGTFYLPGISPSSPSFYSASLTFNQDIFKWLDISAGISRYMVKPELADTLFGSFNYADMKLGADWKILYTEVSYGGFVMKEPPTYLQVRNSRYFETPAFYRKKATVSFQPYVNVLFGTLGTLQTFEGTEMITTTQTYTIPVTVTTTTGSGAGTGAGQGQGPGQPQGQGSGSSSTPGTTTTTTTSTTTETVTTEVPTLTTVYSETFSLLELEFGLPVSLNLNFMSLEAEAGYILPFYSDPAYPSPKGFILSLSAIFKIF
jgi:hypothetical protein